MAKNTTSISPAGRALYPKLTEPDTKFKEEGEYSVKLLLSASEAAPILEQCRIAQEEAIEEEVKKQKTEKPKMSEDKIRSSIKKAELPVKPHEDPETGEETGDFQATFKMKASGVSRKTGKAWTRRPALFDAGNKPIDPSGVEIWSGSILKVAYTPTPFCTAIGAGVTLRMEAVQVIKLESGQRKAEDYGFGEEDGGYSYSPSSSDAPFGESASASGDDGDNGESDF